MTYKELFIQLSKLSPEQLDGNATAYMKAEWVDKIVERLESLPLNDMLIQFNNFNQKEMSRMGREIRHLEDSVNHEFQKVWILKGMLQDLGLTKDEVESKLSARMKAVMEGDCDDWV